MRMMREARAAAIRAGSGARPRVFLRDFGRTSHQTRSSETLQGKKGGAKMSLVRRIESSTEQANPHAGRMRRQ
jgi:hypothetical protein